MPSTPTTTKLSHQIRMVHLFGDQKETESERKKERELEQDKSSVYTTER